MKTSEAWAIGCFQEPFVNKRGPLFFVWPEMIGNYDYAWRRFLQCMGCEDTEANRRKWRKLGYRRVKIKITLELAQKVLERA